MQRRTNAEAVSREVNRVLRDNGEGGRPLSLRRAEELSGVNYSTMYDLARGHVPLNAGIIIRFAKAFNEDVLFWLELCDYEEIVALLRQDRSPPVEENEFEALLSQVPLSRRKKAREAAKRAIEQVIVPIYREATA